MGLTDVFWNIARQILLTACLSEDFDLRGGGGLYLKFVGFYAASANIQDLYVLLETPTKVLQATYNEKILISVSEGPGWH